MTAYIRAGDMLRNAFDCLVVIIHHCGHGGDRPRGHSSLMGALDVQIAVRRDDDNNVVAVLELAKDSEVGTTFLSRLKPVPIFTDQDGDPVTSCVIEEVDEEADEPASGGKAKKWPKHLTVFKRALLEAVDSAGKMSRPLPDMPEVKVVDREAVRTVFHKLYVPASDGGKRKDGGDNITKARNAAFGRHANDAIARGFIGSLNVGPELATTIFWPIWKERPGDTPVKASVAGDALKRPAATMA
jgi:hypothetical protein